MDKKQINKIYNKNNDIKNESLGTSGLHKTRYTRHNKNTLIPQNPQKYRKR